MGPGQVVGSDVQVRSIRVVRWGGPFFIAQQFRSTTVPQFNSLEVQLSYRSVVLRDGLIVTWGVIFKQLRCVAGRCSWDYTPERWKPRFPPLEGVVQGLL